MFNRLSLSDRRFQPTSLHRLNVAELRDRVSSLEAKIAKLTPEPEPVQNPVQTTRTHWEIWCVKDGHRGAFATEAPSLVRAREMASDLARGDLLNYNGDRKPSKPIFELESDETLEDAVKHGDGLYILKKTVRKALFC